jgi:DNA-binding NarL/FixJ family response regulator
MQTRVLLADDNPVVIEILRELLEPGFDVVGAVSDGPSVLREATALNPDVIILDISMGESNGIDVAQRLHEASCHFKVVFLSAHEISEFILSALAVGGSAYVFKSRMKTDLIPAIHAACSGKLFVSCRSI